MTKVASFLLLANLLVSVPVATGRLHGGVQNQAEALDDAERILSYTVNGWKVSTSRPQSNGYVTTDETQVMNWNNVGDPVITGVDASTRAPVAPTRAPVAPTWAPVSGGTPTGSTIKLFVNRVDSSGNIVSSVQVQPQPPT